MKAQGKPKLEKPIAELPPVLRGHVLTWAERLFETENGAPAWFEKEPPGLDILLRLVASSDFASRVLLREWQWFEASLAGGLFAAPPPACTMRCFIDDLVLAVANENDIRSRLRRYRNRQLVHILWRMLAGSAHVSESLRSLSDLADGLIEAAVSCSAQMLSPRFGEPRNAAGEPIPIVVIAMGKLGGRELNFSSDIDIVFAYREDGETDGPRSLSAHEYFIRRSRKIVSLLDDVTEDGFVYRVDTRLRPFGDSGPPVTSFAALESYLVQHARGWERYAYVKARVVAPHNDPGIARELLAEIIEPFVYRQYLDFGVFESLRDMKALISAEVQKRELAANIKLGPGGIREIEFITQSLQLVRGGNDAPLRTPELQVVLPKLANNKGLTRPAAASLLAAYEFLRRLENAVQAMHDRQTHEMPADATGRSRVALAMAYADWPTLEKDFATHRQQVAAQFDKLLFSAENGQEKPGLARDLTSLWDTGASEAEWAVALEEHEFRDAKLLAATICAFASASNHRQLDRTAQQRLSRFIPLLLLLLRERHAARPVLERVLNIVSQIVRRSAYVSLLNENPQVLGRLVGLCENSTYLAQEIARFPVLLDELLDRRTYSTAITAADMREDLAARQQYSNAGDSELQIEVLGQFQRASLFRIAVADHSGNLPIMKVSDRLTELAEIVLNHALDVAWRDLTRKHGVPVYTVGDQPRKAGFAVIAYGKLGGIELSYRSDLDLVFLHDSSGARQETDGPVPLDNSMFFGRLVRRLTHFLTAQTGSGALYEVDTRLRPSGRSGMLVSTVEGFERYQEENAWTWEHQALLRSRPVAGSGAIAREFERIRRETLCHRVHRDQLLEDVISMRARMRKQLDKSDAQTFDLKQGGGGIGDLEFLVQYLVLKNAGEHPAVIYYPDNIRQLGTLGATGCLPETDVLQLQEIYRKFRHCLHRLTLDEQAPVVPATEFMAERELVRRIWERELR
jgi:glutamate-ammonia-ligase adenylyltransferase